MPEQQSEMGEFLKDIPVAEDQKSEDIFGHATTDTPEPEKEKEEEPQKNRRERRLEAKLQDERDSNIFLAAKLEALSEAQKFAHDTTSDVDQNLLRLYGDTDAGRQAAKITQDLLDRTKAQSREEALELFTKRQEAEQAEVRENEAQLSDMLESVEDEFNVDLTSNSPTARRARQGFYAALEKVSPKDKDGMVKDYADPLTTWEYYQLQQKPADTRSKDLASRSMVKSGASGEVKLETSAAERYLKDAGII